MPLTFGDLRSTLDDLAGVDLDDVQRDALLNEAHRELAVRSEWYRATITVAGVTDQESYALPADVYRVLNLRVDSEAYKPSFQQQADRLRTGADSLVIAGIMVGVTLSGLIFGIFAAKSYDKGALDGYEQGRKDGWRASKGLLD